MEANKMCKVCLEEMADARYEGDHERVERMVRRTRIDRVTADEIDDARYEGDHERVERIYRNSEHETNYDYGSQNKYNGRRQK